MNGNGRQWVMVGLALLTAVPVRGQSAPPDAVDALRQVLRTPFTDAAARQQAVRSALEQLTKLGEQGQALLLGDWRDLDGVAWIATVDAELRDELSERFQRSVRAALTQGDATTKLAALGWLGTLGPRLRATQCRHPLTRVFTPDLVRLLADADPAVTVAAARTLGQILPEPAMAVAALVERLDSDSESLRRSAAEGLRHLVRQAAQIHARGRSADGVEVSRTALVETGQAAVQGAGRGCAHADVRVRLSCVATLALAASTLERLVPDGRSQAAPSYSPDDLSALQPLVAALREQQATLLTALADADAAVRRFAQEALEAGAAATARLQRWQEVLKTSPEVVPTGAGEAGATGAELAQRVASLAAAVSDPDVRNRRAAIDALEALGESAAAAGPALVKALGDPDSFVRWAAARALGRLAGMVDPGTALPPLIRLLEDADGDVRRSAAKALEHFGTAALPATAALVRCVRTADADLRVAAIRALQAIGPNARPALAALAEALSDRDARTREAAAVALGRFGSAAAEAVPQLRQALTDDNPEVRKAASAALLVILEAGKP